jgi:hypothetical protein
MDDGATVVQSTTSCPTLAWNDVVWQVLGMFLAGVLLIGLVVVGTFLIIDWRRNSQRIWPK